MGSDQFNEKPRQSGRDAGETSNQTLEEASEEFHDAKIYQEDEEMTSICSDIRAELARLVAMIDNDKASAIDVPVVRSESLNLEKIGEQNSEAETSKKP
ncbi:hypothetical protein MCOR25_000206 [Pyricularia grisea]|nr:hypothetical protein MCOR25_000206 [Pyricularia grisea]